jgi:DNA polymerase-3 subunit epsilon
MIREIVFDTETTGLSPESGDKIVEIGAIELINHVPTGRSYHQYVNPERDIPEEAIEIHGLTNEFLKDYPAFREVAKDFLEFIGDDKLIAHNASFDIKFINFELNLLGYDSIGWNRVVDTLEISRKKFPGAKNNLDALCKRFGVDNSNRAKHGALLDSELLAAVYLELMGGAEPSMLIKEDETAIIIDNSSIFLAEKKMRKARIFTISFEEEAKHENFLREKLKDARWLKDA